MFMRFVSILNPLFMVCLFVPISAMAANTQPDSKTSEESISLTYVVGEDGIGLFTCAGSRNFSITRRPVKPLVAEPIYNSQRPMYSSIQLGPDKSFVICMALDESRGTHTGYDTLYLDANNNLDLTDDTKLKSNGSAFPVVEVMVKYGEREYPCHLKIDVSGYGAVSGHMKVVGYLKGSVSLEGKQHAIKIVDYDNNGVFSDQKVLQESLGCAIDPLSRDILFVDFNGDGEFDVDGGNGLEILPFSRYLPWGDTCYEISLDPSGRFGNFTATKAPCGRVDLGTPYTDVVLINQEGTVFVRGKESAVPEGKYRVYLGSVDAKDDAGQQWRVLLGNELSRKPPFVVTAGKTTYLKAGAPFTVEVTAYKQASGNYILVLGIKGQGDESYYLDSFRVLGKSEKAVTSSYVRIMDKKGNEIVRGNLEDNKRYLWQVPDGLKGEFTAIPEVTLGPFPITAVGKKITVE